MNLDYFVSQMNHNAQTVRQLIAGVSLEQARWKPDPDSWSILEVVNHLYDEEQKDFRVRLDYILHHPDQSWPSIDPGGWVTANRYNQRALEPSVENFLQARKESLAWLKSLSDINWQASYKSPFGIMTAGDMFASWVAHDLLHIRQLVELKWAYTTRELHPFNAEYAGSW